MFDSTIIGERCFEHGRARTLREARGITYFIQGSENLFADGVILSLKIEIVNFIYRHSIEKKLLNG